MLSVIRPVARRRLDPGNVSQPLQPLSRGDAEDIFQVSTVLTV